MPDVVRCFNEQGLAEFSRWLHADVTAAVPASLLNDNDFSTSLEKSQIPKVPLFKDRYEFGVFLVGSLILTTRITFPTTQVCGAGSPLFSLSNSHPPTLKASACCVGPMCTC